jgi:hypothetical protein
MSHWDLVARCLRNKVSDKSMLVRRWAMKGLESMLFQNPFGPNLVLEYWRGLLDEYEAVLEARAPAEDKDASPGMLTTFLALMGDNCFSCISGYLHARRSPWPG